MAGDKALTRRPSAAVLVGRSLAAFVHPVAAWRSRSRAYRAHVIVTYAAAGYVLTLTALTTLLPRL